MTILGLRGGKRYFDILKKKKEQILNYFLVFPSPSLEN